MNSKMSKTANAEPKRKKCKRNKGTDEEEKRDEKIRNHELSTDARPADFPISCDANAPTYYDKEYEITALMHEFGKRNKIEYTSITDGILWVFTCKGCEYVQARFKYYAKLSDIVKRHDLDVTLVPCPEYPDTAHRVFLSPQYDGIGGQASVHAIDYEPGHCTNCYLAYRLCPDGVPSNELAINEVAKATVRAICKRMELMAPPHREGSADGLSNTQLAQIEVLDRVLTEIESVL